MPLSLDRVRWNQRYSDASFIPDWAPDVVLAQRLPELPKGRALDVASGVGSNSLFLAKRGYEVDAFDMSDVAVESLRRAAASEGVLDRINLTLADIRQIAFQREAYDLVLAFRFFFPDLAPRLADALKPGGTLLCRVFTTAHRQYQPHWPAERFVGPGALPGLFPGLESQVYEESDLPGDAHAIYLGRKR